MAMRPRKIGEGLYQPLADINVTPLVDVMLGSADHLHGDRADAGRRHQSEPAERQDRAAARKQGAGHRLVAKDGALSVGRDPVSSDQLAATVKAKLGDSNGVVQLRGDRDAPYGDVVSVMDELAANGISRIAIVSGPRRSVSPTPPATNTPTPAAPNARTP